VGLTQLVERGEERRVNKRGSRVLSSVGGGGDGGRGSSTAGGEGFVEFALFRLCA